MIPSLLKYSKQELMRLLQSSLAVAGMDKEQRNILRNVVAGATDEQLVELFGILRDERHFLDKTEEDFSKKFVKIMDDFVMSAKAEVYKIKHKRNRKAEEKTDKHEKIIEQELLKKLKQV